MVLPVSSWESSVPIVAVQMSVALDPAMADEPSSKLDPLKETEEMVSVLLSPVAESSKRATAVLPNLQAPEVPLHPVTVMFPAERVGTMESTVAFVVSEFSRLFELASVAETETLLLVSSIPSEPVMV